MADLCLRGRLDRGGSKYAMNRSGDNMCYRERGQMAKGMPPGRCAVPNCPWRHVNDPPERELDGTHQRSGTHTTRHAEEILDDPNDWTVRKCVPTEHGLCRGGGRQKSH